MKGRESIVSAAAIGYRLKRKESEMMPSWVVVSRPGEGRGSGFMIHETLRL